MEKYLVSSKNYIKLEEEKPAYGELVEGVKRWDDVLALMKGGRKGREFDNQLVLAGIDKLFENFKSIEVECELDDCVVSNNNFFGIFENKIFFKNLDFDNEKMSLRNFKIFNEKIDYVSGSNKFGFVVIGCKKDGVMSIWKGSRACKTGMRIVSEFKFPDSGLRKVEFSKNDHLLCTITECNEIQVWKFKDVKGAKDKYVKFEEFEELGHINDAVFLKDRASNKHDLVMSMSNELENWLVVRRFEDKMINEFYKRPNIHKIDGKILTLCNSETAPNSFIGLFEGDNEQGVNVFRIEKGEFEVVERLCSFTLDQNIQVSSHGRILSVKIDNQILQLWAVFDEGDSGKKYQKIFSRNYFFKFPDKIRISNHGHCIMIQQERNSKIKIFKLFSEIEEESKFELDLNQLSIKSRIQEFEIMDDSNLMLIKLTNGDLILKGNDIESQTFDTISNPNESDHRNLIGSRTQRRHSPYLEKFSNGKDKFGKFLRIKDNIFVVSCTCDGYANLWVRNSKGFEILSKCEIGISEVSSLSVIESRRLKPQGKDGSSQLVLVGGENGSLNILKIYGIFEKKIKMFQELKICENEIGEMAVSEFQNIICVVGKDKCVYILGREIGSSGCFQLTQRIENISQPSSIDITPDGSLMVIGTRDKKIEVFNIQRIKKSTKKIYKLKEVLDNFSSEILKVKFYNDQKYLVIKTKGGKVIVTKEEKGLFKVINEVDYSSICHIAPDLSKIIQIEQEETTVVKELSLRKLKTLPKSWILYQILHQMFDNDHSLASPEYFLELISYLKWIGLSSGERKLDILVHSQIRILSLAALTYQPELVKGALEEFGYMPFYYGDHNPLKNILSGFPTEIVGVFCDYFEEGGIPDLDEDLFLKVLKSHKSRLKEIVISSFFSEKNPFDYKYPSHLLLIKHYNKVLLTSPNYLGDGTIQKKYWELSQRSGIINKLASWSEYQVEYRVSSFKVNMDLASPFTISILKSLEHSEDSVLISDIRSVVFHLWDLYLPFLLMHFLTKSYFILYFLYSVSFHANQILFLKYIHLGITAWLLFFEMTDVIQDPLGYSKRFQNYVDIYLFISITIIIHFVHDDKFNPMDSQDLNGFITLTMLFSGVRFLSFLKIVAPLRFLIAMILQAISDMIPFTLILFASIAVFSFIDLQARKAKVATSSNFTDIGVSINYVYNLALGAWNPLTKDQLVFVDIINFVFNTSFFNLLMINLLIAIISRTFENFQNNKEAINVRDSIGMILEVGYFLKTFKLWNKKPQKSYLHYAKPIEVTE